MRVPDIPDLKGRELFEYLVKNKADIIAQKKSMPIKSDPFLVDSSTEYFEPIIKTKAEGEADDPDTINVKVIANTSMYCDSHQDVLGADCWKKSIRERKGRIPHIHDHIHEVTAQVGKVSDVYSEDIELRKIGVKSDIKTAQALVMNSEVRRSLNPKVFELYKSGLVTQHSIGLQYVKIDLAVNSDDDDLKTERKLWNKYIDQVINRKAVEERGYFWYVSEIKVFENSAVLFGSNDLTPTLEAGKSEPLQDTQDEEKSEPSNDTPKKTSISIVNFI